MSAQNQALTQARLNRGEKIVDIVLYPADIPFSLVDNVVFRDSVKFTGQSHYGNGNYFDFLIERR